MARRKLIAANWKMNKTISEAVVFASEFRRELSGLPDADIVVFPSFFCVRPLVDALADTRVAVGAQDLYWEPAGAYTGEVSAAMVADAGARWVLVGHSERRHVLGESDAVVARKLKASAEAGLRPVLCVGETLEEREQGRQEAVVVGQLDAAFSGWTSEDAAAVVVAYEPVWAIGTGRTATPEDAAVMHRAVRDWMRTTHGRDAAERQRILYGGSVRAGNAGELLGTEGVDGVLVGGASLDPAGFAAIARAAGASPGGAG